MSGNEFVEQEVLPAPNEAARRALAAVRLTSPEVGEDVTPDSLGHHAPDAVPDLITDVMHLLRLAGEDVYDAIGQARRDYRDEVSGTVVVLIENSYECGHASSTRVVLFAPEPGDDLDTWWTETVFVLTGDPHDCGSDRETASCRVQIVDAPVRPELLGRTYGWDG